MRSPQTVSSRRASRLHIQQPLHPRTSGCPLGLEGQRQATQAWLCPHWPGRSKPARRNGNSEPPGGAGAQACARWLTGLPRSLLSPLGPSQHRDPGPRPPATWAPWPRGPHPTGAADCPRPRGCMRASGGPGLSTDPQDVARGAVPPPPRVTGETWPLGKDEAHLGDQGPWREGQSYGLRARASPHGYVLGSDRPEPSPRGGARAGRPGQEAWQAPTSAPPPVPRVSPGHECGHPGSAAVHRSPGSLSAGRAGPPPLCLPCPPPGGGTCQLSLHSELGLACFCPFCLPYTLNLIEFQGRFQSHLEYGKKKKGIRPQK